MKRALKRFFIGTSLNQHFQAKSNARVVLSGEETHHLKHVLRMQEGDLCLLFDAEGDEFISRLERYLPDQSSEMTLIEPIQKNFNAASFQLTVAQAIPQDRKMDDIVRQATELGIYCIIPLITEHSIVRIPKNKSDQVMKRWQRIAEQALKQSRQNRAPKMTEPMNMNALFGQFDFYRHIFICDTSSGAEPIKEVVTKALENALLIIGPEGGFSIAELEGAERLGAKRVSLGHGILRTDTAFVAAVSFLKLSQINEFSKKS